MWLQHNFLVPDVVPVKITSDIDWSICIKPLREGSAINLKYSSGTMTLVTENMGLAAEIVQSIANYLNIDKLEVRSVIYKQVLDLFPPRLHLAPLYIWHCFSRMRSFRRFLSKSKQCYRKLQICSRTLQKCRPQLPIMQL